jgi:hypothetical protein
MAVAGTIRAVEVRRYEYVQKRAVGSKPIDSPGADAHTGRVYKTVWRHSHVGEVLGLHVGAIPEELAAGGVDSNDRGRWEGAGHPELASECSGQGAAKNYPKKGDLEFTSRHSSPQ